MSEETAIPTITEESMVADVVAYVGWKLQHLEIVEDLKRFIQDQDVNGSLFLSLNNEALVNCGLSSAGKRMYLLKLVEALKKNQWHAPPNFPLNRKKRWEELVSNIPQLIVNRNVKKQKYVAFSDIKLNQVSSIYNIENYVQNRFSIPDADFEQLHRKLNLAVNKSLGDTEARKVHLISLVISCLTRIVPGLKL
jgi:hypothetical protein